MIFYFLTPPTSLILKEIMGLSLNQKLINLFFKCKNESKKANF